MMSAYTVRAKGILLDIEGTTSSISFVHDVMFPFVREHLDRFLSECFDRADVQSACEQIARDAGHMSLQAWAAIAQADSRALVTAEVIRLMDGDVKATGLKALQGLIWQLGFSNGDLRAHVYPDVIPAIKRWRQSGCDVRIYSSGSVAAQKLFFGHLDGYGNCLELFSGHYDTNIGSKKELASYQRIASDWDLAPSEIVFISDLAAELEAARAAKFQVYASVRAGNAALPADCDLPQLTSFDDLRLSLCED